MLNWIRNKYYGLNQNNLEEEIIKTEKIIDELSVRTTQGRENLYTIFQRALSDTEVLIEKASNELEVIENHRISLKTKQDEIRTEKYKMEKFKTNLSKLFEE